MAEALRYTNGLYQIAKTNNWPHEDQNEIGPFLNGKIAAIVTGNWSQGDMAQGLGDQLAVASLPAGPGGPAKPMLGYDGYFISAESRHKEAALMAALFLTSQNSQRKMMEAAGHIPSRDDVEITNPLTRQVLEAINRGNTLRPQNPEFNKYWAFFCDTKAIYENNTPIEDWLNAATNNANK